MNIAGIHHVTSLASDPQVNLEFYVGFLGMRLVKQTVNFDAPDVYHFYYGDETGQPGTLLTFFPFPDAARGKRGAGETSAVAFSVPPGSFDFWVDRLTMKGLPFTGPGDRFGEKVLSFEDPDGMAVELCEDLSVIGTARWPGSAVQQAFAIRRLHGVTLTHRDAGPTASFLTDTLGFSAGDREDSRHRFLSRGLGRIDIVVDPAAPPARQSAGSVHHIAWRAKDDAEQREWRQRLVDAGASPTRVVDRRYFHSIYFREPGGVLFEIATDPPGFLTDETVETLGTRLRLPPWLEADRARRERRLPPISLPAPAARGTP